MAPQKSAYFQNLSYVVIEPKWKVKNNKNVSLKSPNNVDDDIKNNNKLFSVKKKLEDKTFIFFSTSISNVNTIFRFYGQMFFQT